MLPQLSRLVPLLTILATLAPSPLWPHGGGLDAYGCHHNRVHGGYHCHRGKFTGSMFESKAEMLRTQEFLTSPQIHEFSGTVVSVTDGDTITVLSNSVGEKVRLYGIDCPEKRQPFGKRAKQFTSSLVFEKHVRVEDHGRDRYKRMIGEVVLSDGRNVNHELVSGLEVGSWFGSGVGHEY